jgi:DNA-binding MarR family transcriptional regulator
MINKDALLKLDNQLCFLLYAGSRAVTKKYRPLLENLGLTYPQYLVMLVLWENDGIPVKQLSIKLSLDTGTLTPLLKRLETAGLITRTRTSSDERSVEINLTPDGTALKEKAYAVPGELLCSSGLSIDEFIRLRGELRMLLDKLSENDNDGCSDN